MAEPTPTPMLPYADSLARDRVSVERGDDYLRVISPPLGTWRKLPRRYYVAMTVLSAMVALMALTVLLDWTGDGRDAFLANAAVWSGVVLLLLAVAHDRVRSSVVFELTQRTLTMTRLTP